MNRGRGARVGAALLVLLIAPTRGVASEPDDEQHAHGAPLPEAAQLDPRTAAVARRLWGDLVCLCGRCERLKLSACHCSDAAAERKNVLALLRGRELATPAGAETAYQAVLGGYVKRKGRQVLASERTSSAAADWPALLVSVAVLALGCGAIAALELRRRKRPRASRRGSRR